VSVRLVLVDDHQLLRQCMRKMLESRPGFEVVGEAADGRAAIDLVRDTSPDAVVMDIEMKSMNGIEATRMINRQSPAVKVIAVSMHDDPRYVREALTAGASAYLLKECAFAELVTAIGLAVEDNEIYLSPGISKVLVDGYLSLVQGRSLPRDQTANLTPREREIVQLIAEGHTNVEIANVLFLSVRTIENHRLNIMKKLGVDSLAALVKLAVREGLTPP